MAATPKNLFRGAATTNTSTTLYTVPASTTTVVSSVVVTNTVSTDATFTLALNGTSIATAVLIPGNALTTIDMKQVITAAQIIQGGASAVTVNFHIEGVEIV